MLKKINPYNFDYKRESKKYAKICKAGKKSMPYQKWREIILLYIEKFNITNTINFKHYLINERRSIENKIKLIKDIIIPTNILIFSVFMAYISILINLVGNDSQKILNLSITVMVITNLLFIAIGIVLIFYIPFRLNKLLRQLFFFRRCNRNNRSTNKNFTEKIIEDC